MMLCPHRIATIVIGLAISVISIALSCPILVVDAAAVSSMMYTYTTKITFCHTVGVPNFVCLHLHMQMCECMCRR